MIELTRIDMLMVLALLPLVAALSRWRGMPMQTLLWPGVRMVLQLSLLGFVLEMIFTVRNGFIVLVLLLVMAGFAVQTVVSRLEHRFPGVYQSVTIALLCGCGSATFYFCNLIVVVDPWYDPRYLIPLAGMVFGNSMTGASLAAERLTRDLIRQREEIETYLSLGATPRQAVKTIVHEAYYAALIPTINAMAVMGLVFIPGMMTGQILSGVEPFTAVAYQIAIMCVISFSVAVTCLLILELGYRSCFTKAWQLRRMV